MVLSAAKVYRMTSEGFCSEVRVWYSGRLSEVVLGLLCGLLL